MSIEGGKHCFPLMIYGFCSSNVLYSASLSFKIFIFLIVPSDTWDCNSFKSNLSLLIYIKVLLVKHITLFCSPRNINKQLFSSVYFCVYPVLQQGGIVMKMFSEKGYREKRYKGRGWGWGRWPYRRVIYRGGASTSWALWCIS